MPATADQLSGQPQSRALGDAEAALRLINAALQVQGLPNVELPALEVAQARTISALQGLLADNAFWDGLAQSSITAHNEDLDAESALVDAVTATMVRVGHVSPPPAAEVIADARCALQSVGG